MDLKSNVKDKNNLEARLACMMFSKKNMAIIPVTKRMICGNKWQSRYSAIIKTI